MKPVRRICITLLSLFVLVWALAGYALYIEPNLIVTRTHYLEGKATSNQEVLRVVQISDTHISRFFNEDQLDKLVEKVNLLEPDIVVFTGDLFDNFTTYGSADKVTLSLANLQSRYGKFAIWGNHDYGGGAVRIYPNLMANSGFTLLKNQGTSITTDAGKQLFIGGVDDYLLGTPSVEETLSYNTIAYDYSMILLHEPDPSTAFAGTPVDLLLAGHSHGGQVYIPFNKGIKTTLAHNFQRGFHTIDEQNQMQLYVNTGIGTTKQKIRFGVPPEITVFEIAL